MWEATLALWLLLLYCFVIVDKFYFSYFIAISFTPCFAIATRRKWIVYCFLPEWVEPQLLYHLKVRWSFYLCIYKPFNFNPYLINMLSAYFAVPSDCRNFTVFQIIFCRLFLLSAFYLSLSLVLWCIWQCLEVVFFIH